MLVVVVTQLLVLPMALLLFHQTPQRPALLPLSSLNFLPSFHVQAWEWSDWVGGTRTSTATSGAFGAFGADQPVKTLSIQEVSELRVRELKRRLARSHGYSAEELDIILDKKELIHALAFEEEKIRLRQEENIRRTLLLRGIVAAVVAVLVVLCWPLIQHAFELANINWVVYMDRKKHEASRCLELKSLKGVLGVLLMGILDLMQLWLTTSILLSWVTTHKWWFFPVPRLSVRPAALMGGPMAQSPLANYGINLGSMAVTWAMRFVYRKIELWTGKALAAAHRQQRRAAREWETVDDRAARKAARKQAKLEKQQRRQQQVASSNNHVAPPSWMDPVEATSNPQPSFVTPPDSRAHQDFIDQLDESETSTDKVDGKEPKEVSPSKFDELD